MQTALPTTGNALKGPLSNTRQRWRINRVQERDKNRRTRRNKKRKNIRIKLTMKGAKMIQEKK